MSASRSIRLLVTTGIAEDEAELEQFHDEVQQQIAEGNVELDNAFEDQ